MSIKFVRNSVNSLLLVITTAIACQSLWAQENPNAEADLEGDDDAIEMIVVTGSLLSRSGFDTPTPVTSIGEEDIQRIGGQDIAIVIRQLPAVRDSLNPAAASNNSTYAAGSYFDLRGIGFARTLTLVDGRRYVPTLASGAVNSSTLPQVLIRGVDVVTGGASATYGADAVAGVVNFLMDDDFRGVKGKIQAGISDYNDYGGYLTSLAFGTDFLDGRVGLTLAGEIFENEGIEFIGDRPWAEGAGLISNPAYTPTNDEPRLLMVSNIRNSNASDGGVITSPSLLTGIQFTPDGSPVPFEYGTLVSSSSMVGGGGRYGAGKSNGSNPYERQSFFGRLTFEATEKVELFAELSYALAEANYLNISVSEQLTIMQDNPFVPESIRDVMIAENIPSFRLGRAIEDNARETLDISNETIQAVVGAEGDFGGTWGWNVYYSNGRTTVDRANLDSRITANFNLALDAVLDPSTGTIVCRSTLTDPTNGCIPINLIGEGRATQSALNYVTGNGWRQTLLKQNVLAGTVMGEVFSTWAGPVDFAFGLEHREFSADITSDAISQQFGFRFGGAIPYSGEVTVKEAFSEVNIPLAADTSWARDLSLNLSGRRTDYSTSGPVNTWKTGLNYTINDSIRLRATRSRDIRAPGLDELFAAGSTSLLSAYDPVREESYTVTALNVGNPDLTPEEADTITAGIVFTPESLAGISASLDYYDIKIEDAIIGLTPATIVAECYNGSPNLCASINRPSPGERIESVRNGPVNFQEVSISGVDLELAYSTSLWSGDLDVRSLVSYIHEAKIEDPLTVSKLDDAVHQPTIAAVGGNPTWKSNLRLTYSQNEAMISTAARYVGGGLINPNYTTKDLADLRVDGVWYWDISGEYPLRSGDDSSIVLYGSIRNLLDQDPPITGVGGHGTTRALYDTIGRLYNVGVRARF